MAEIYATKGEASDLHYRILTFPGTISVVLVDFSLRPPTNRRGYHASVYGKYSEDARHRQYRIIRDCLMHA